MQGFIGDLKGKKPDKAKKDKQKEAEISAIQASIVRYHLSKFCKANATALALIFKALLRGEAIYPKTQFLQDLSAEKLLSYKEKESQYINQENSQNNIPKDEILKKPNQKENTSKDSTTANVESKETPSSNSPLNIEG